MAFWSRPARQPEFEYSCPTSARGGVATQRGEARALDDAVDRAHAVGMHTDPEETWRLLAQAYPEVGSGGQPLTTAVATYVGGVPPAATMLFLTDTHLYAAGNLDQLVAYDFTLLQSVGMVSGGHPRLQVLSAREAGSRRLEVGVFELGPNKWTGLLWKGLRDVVAAARPDLAPHAAGWYGGLGVPPPATDGAPWYAPPAVPAPRGR
jgi:hypothetical protein